MFLALSSMMLLDGVQSAACAMHGMGQGSAHAAAMLGHAAFDHAAFDHAAAGHSMDQHDAPSNDSGSPNCECTCIGACTMVAPLAKPPIAATLRVALVAPQPHRALDREPDASPPREPDRLLPFANGPPASALV